MDATFTVLSPPRRGAYSDANPSAEMIATITASTGGHAGQHCSFAAARYVTAADMSSYDEFRSTTAWAGIENPPLSFSRSASASGVASDNGSKLHGVHGSSASAMQKPPVVR